jgi:hypothetical protein
LLAFGFVDFDLFVVSDADPLLGELFGRFEIPKIARKTVRVAMRPAFCFMTTPQLGASAGVAPQPMKLSIGSEDLKRMHRGGMRPIHVRTLHDGRRNL